MDPYAKARAAADALAARFNAAPVVVGILNVTPDSFSDGGLFVAAEAALDHALAMAVAGADIIDIGAESTRPGHVPVGEAEEWARLEPVLAPLLARVALPVSVDTTKSFVARRALALGAAMINDVSGLRADPVLAEVAAESGAALVVMHHCAEIDSARDIVADMFAFFDETLARAQKAGVAREKIVLDPGVGFGKTLRQNLQAIDACGALHEEYRPAGADRRLAQEFHWRPDRRAGGKSSRGNAGRASARLFAWGDDFSRS